MSLSFFVWCVVLLALLAANFPFFTQRVFGFYVLHAGKSLAVRLLELLSLYLLVGGIALFMEKTAGQIAPQGWEFYAITSAVFLTSAFPGFVYCYLLKRSS